MTNEKKLHELSIKHSDLSFSEKQESHSSSPIDDVRFFIHNGRKTYFRSNEYLKQKVEEAIKKYSWNDRRIPIMQLFEKESTLATQLKNRAFYDVGFFSVGRILQQYGFEPSKLSIDDVKEYFKEILTPHVINYIYEFDLGDERLKPAHFFGKDSKLLFKLQQQDKPNFTKKDYDEQLRFGKRVKEVLYSSKRKDIINLRKQAKHHVALETILNTTFSSLEKDFGQPLYEAFIGKQQYTQEYFSKKLTQWFYEGKNILGGGLTELKAGSIIKEYLKNNKNVEGRIPFQNSFNTKEAHRLLKKIPQSYLEYQSKKRTSLLEDLLEEEVHDYFEKSLFLFEIARLYDSDLGQIEGLQNIISGNIEKIQEKKTTKKQQEKNSFLEKSMNYAVRVKNGKKKINYEVSVFGKEENHRLKTHMFIKEEGVDAMTLLKDDGSTTKGYFTKKDFQKLYDSALHVLLKHEPFFFDVALQYKSLTEKIVDLLEVPGIKLRDIQDSKAKTKRQIGTNSEYEVGLFFSIVQHYDSHFKKFIDLRSFLDEPLKKIIYRDKRTELRLGGEELFPEETPLSRSKGESDFKLLSGEKTYLVEIKNYVSMRKPRVNEIIAKHFGVHTWSDGTPMDKKIFILNGRGRGFEKYEQDLTRSGLSVISPTVMNKNYLEALDFLFEKEPRIMSAVKTRLAGSPEEQLHKLKALHKLNTENAHLLRRNGNAYLAEWYGWLTKDLFRTTQQLVQGSSIDELLFEDRVDFQKEYIFPFSKFRNHYGAVLDTINDSSFLKDILFFDLETNGFVRSGKPLNLIGMAYYHKGYGEMVSHVLVARDPYEEKEVLDRFQSIAKKYSFLSGFNSKRFDIHFFNERLIANYSPLEVHAHHIDLLDYWVPFAKQKHLSEFSLQAFEKSILGLNELRSGDVKGEDIPRFYNMYLKGENEMPFGKVIGHNHFDNIANVLLYSFLKEKNKL